MTTNGSTKTKTAPASDAVTDLEMPVQAIRLHRVKRSTTVVRIRGIAPLIVNQWSAKARQMMLDKQMGVPVDRKAPKNPDEDFEGTRYRLADGRDGFPAVAFKSAIVNAVSLFDNLTKVMTKMAVFVEGDPDNPELVPLILEGPPERREDAVRISTTADLRYRAQYWPWGADLRITYIDSVLTGESVLALVDAAGQGGVGEWRPSAPRSYTGMFGRFEIVGDTVGGAE